MNKQAVRKAFIVCATIGVVYTGIAFNVQDKFSMHRTHAEKKGPQGLNLIPVKTEENNASPTSGVKKEALPGPDTIKQRTQPVITGDEAAFEPSFLIAIPIIAYSIREELIEKDAMIFVAKTNDPASTYLKKPLDILEEKDVEGLKSLARMIGKKNIDSFLRKEGITLPDKTLAIDTIAGIGYSIDKNLLLNLYRKYVGEGFDPLLPYAAAGFEISKKNGSFQLTTIKSNKYPQAVKESSAFTMPDLAGLSMKKALDTIAQKVGSVKIHGSGTIIDQFPKPNEKVGKDTLCILYGRTYQR